MNRAVSSVGQSKLTVSPGLMNMASAKKKYKYHWENLIHFPNSLVFKCKVFANKHKEI